MEDSQSARLHGLSERCGVQIATDCPRAGACAVTPSPLPPPPIYRMGKLALKTRKNLFKNIYVMLLNQTLSKREKKFLLRSCILPRNMFCVGPP
jgi:hypothetical protein